MFQLWEEARSCDQLIALYKRGQGPNKRCEPSYINTVNGDNSLLDSFVPVEALCTFAPTRASPESESMVCDITRFRTADNQWALLATPRSGGHARLAIAFRAQKSTVGVMYGQIRIGSFLHPFEHEFVVGSVSTGNAALAVDTFGNKFKLDQYEFTCKPPVPMSL
jgi:hypothetical protein